MRPAADRTQTLPDGPSYQRWPRWRLAGPSFPSGAGPAWSAGLPSAAAAPLPWSAAAWRLLPPCSCRICTGQHLKDTQGGSQPADTRELPRTLRQLGADSLRSDRRDRAGLSRMVTQDSQGPRATGKGSIKKSLPGRPLAPAHPTCAGRRPSASHAALALASSPQRSDFFPSPSQLAHSPVQRFADPTAATHQHRGNMQ